jgi:D-xylose 1-dehydrogenase
MNERTYAMGDGFAIYPSLREKVVLVTGGASGIGAEMVVAFAAQGSRVSFVDLDDAGAQKVIAATKAIGGYEATFRHCDLRDIVALQEAIALVGRDVGPVTTLVNNAANDQRHALEEVTTAYWDERFQVNLRHHFFAIQAVAPIMRQVGFGSIVNLGSISWRAGMGGMPAYTASKAAIEGLTRSMARDLGADRIRVNCVLPGWIATERQLSLWLTPEVERDVMKAQCLKERLTPADVARLVLWLAADDSRMCTGQNWIVDGGWI